MTLELANRSIAYPAGIVEDIFVQVGKFTFPLDFVIVDYDVDPRVPLILRRPFLRTAHALVDVYGEELILRDGDEKLIFHAEGTSKYPHKHGDESINMINFIDITCEDHFHEVLQVDNGIYDSKGDILFLERLLNDEIPRDLPPKELKDDELKTTKSSTEKPHGIDNGIYDSEGDILFLEGLLNDEIPRDLPLLELNNDPEGDILFLENLLKDEPSETERVSETPLDSFDSSLDSFDTTFTNPLFELNFEYPLNCDNLIFDIQNEGSDASEIETIMDEVQIDSLQSTAQIPPLFKALIPDMTMHDIILYRIRHVFDPGTMVIKDWIKHYYGGDIHAMDVPYLHFPLRTNKFGVSQASDSLINKRFVGSNPCLSWIPYDREDHRACFQSSNHSVSDHLNV
ncbi:reverse transcriptase domain-containing protein [Tanacetum coccineum]